MNVTITVFDASTAAELDAASTFLSDLAGIRSEYEAPKGVSTTEPAATEAATPARRTRKPRAAAQAPAAAEPAAPAAAEPAAPAAAEAAAPAAAEAAASKTSAEDWDTNAASGKTYTEADVQALATVVARAHGPDVVKEKIAELGGARIADLDAAKLNALGAFLETKK